MTPPYDPDDILTQACDVAEQREMEHVSADYQKNVRLFKERASLEKLYFEQMIAVGLPREVAIRNTGNFSRSYWEYFFDGDE